MHTYRGCAHYRVRRSALRAGLGSSLSRDEILNGKTLEQNSHYFAKYCFEHGVQL
ncbi:hypothetical protein BDZ89DRAFT_1083780, partial [Hymenopellis radicata]